MEKHKPLILISNDDGYSAKGINELAKTLAGLGEIVIMAPDGPRSGASAAITSEFPVRYYKVKEEEELTIYKCTGTPVDCVKLALFELLPRCPDLIVGGINHGDNSSVNVHYSGTMGVVIEGCLKGVPAIGFSICDHGADADFSHSKPFVQEIVSKVLDKGLPPLTCLNVNIPAVSDLKGIKVCEQTKGVWVNEWENINHRGDDRYYWLTGNFENEEPENEKNDHWALNNGYVAITPTTVDVTAYGLLAEMKQWF